MTTFRELHHELEWDERLWDWLDGALDPARRSGIERHLQCCETCSLRLVEFRSLDRRLRQAVEPAGLDSDFDRRVLAQLSGERADRAAARRRIAREIEAERAVLARSWRNSLLRLVPGMLAGVVTTTLLAQWLGSQGALSKWLPAMSIAGSGASSLLIALLGAGIGATMASCLSAVLES